MCKQRKWPSPTSPGVRPALHAHREPPPSTRTTYSYLVMPSRQEPPSNSNDAIYGIFHVRHTERTIQPTMYTCIARSTTRAHMYTACTPCVCNMAPSYARYANSGHERLWHEFTQHPPHTMGGEGLARHSGAENDTRGSQRGAGGRRKLVAPLTKQGSTPHTLTPAAGASWYLPSFPANFVALSTMMEW